MRYKLGFLLILILIPVVVLGQTSETLQTITAQNADKLIPLQFMGRGSITYLTLNSGEDRLAVGTQAGVWMYDTEDLSRQPTYFAHQDWVDEIVFNADDTVMAVIGFNSTLRVWSVANHELLWEYNGVVSRGLSWEAVVFDETGSVLIATLEDQIVEFEVTTGHEISRFSLFEDLPPAVEELTLSENGELLAVAFGTSQGSRLELWDIQSQEHLWSVEVRSTSDDWNPYAIWTIAFDPTEPLVTIGSNDGNIQSRFIDSGEIAFSWDGWDGVSDLKYTTDGNYLVAASVGYLRFWSVPEGTMYSAVENRRGTTLLGLSYISISQDGQTIYAASSDDRLLVWERIEQSFDLLDELNEFGSTYTDTSISYMPLPGIVLKTNGDPTLPYSNRIQGWNISTGVQAFAIEDFQYISDVVVSDNYIIGAGNTVNFWGRETHELELTLSDYEGESFFPSDIALSPDRKFLAISRYGGYYSDGASDIFVWDIEERRFVARLTLATDFIESIVFNPVQQQLGFVSRTTDSDTMEIMTWDYLENQEAETVTQTKTGISAVGGLMNFHPDGEQLAFYGDGDIWLYNPTTEALMNIVDTENTHVMNIAFNSRGDLLTVGYLDATVVVSIVEPDNPNVLTNIGGSESLFIDDDTKLLTIGRSGLITIWGVLDN